MGAGGSGVAERNVRFRQTQVVLQIVRIPLDQALEQLDADFGVAGLQHDGGGHDVQGAQQAGSGAVAKVRIKLAAAPRTLLDFGHQIGGTQAFVLHQAARHRGPRKHRRRRVFRVCVHDVVGVFAIGERIVASVDQGFEGVRERQHVLPVRRRRELGVDRLSAQGTRRGERDQGNHHQGQATSDATMCAHGYLP